MFDSPIREWQVPSADARESRKLGWLNESCQEGEAWNRSQRGYSDWRRSLDILAGAGNEKDVLRYRSQVSGNRLKTNIQTTISGLAAIRPLWGYHGSKQYENYALMMNKTTRALYLENFWDQSVKEALQWMAATNTGWIRPVYQRDQAGWGKGNIQLLTYGQPSILPVQMPANGDYQKAYCVNLMEEMPIYMAHSMFPLFQDRLIPTSSRYWYASEINAAAQGNARKRSWWNPFKRNASSSLSDLFIPLRYSTIIDLSINNTGQTIPMGQPGSPWFYEVPTYDPTGKIYGKPIDENAARMYPYRRLMISSQDCICYDGPTFNWHGELDLVPFCADRWPWEPMGFSLVHDGYSLQKAIDQIDRGNMDKVNASMDMPLGYDMNAVGKREADQFDPMQPRGRIAFDGSQVNQPFAPPVPPEVYEVKESSLKLKEQFEAALDYNLQTRDVVEMAKARALGKGMDQLEALIAANGPIVKDISRGMERSLARIGHQVKYLVLQYMDATRLMQYVGEDGITQEIFDYNPTDLIPSHMPGESTHDSGGTAVSSGYNRMQRARWFADNLRFFIMPHSVHELTQMTYRLMLLQMRQRGAPIDWGTILEACDVPDVKLADGSTTQDRFWAEKEEEIEKAARMQQIVQAIGIDAGLIPGGAMPNGSTPEGGRPPTGQEAPQLKHKGDGRPLISESG